MLDEAKTFFNELTKKESDEYLDLVYVFVELGWSQKDFEEAELPFMFDYLRKKTQVLKEEVRRSKKRK